MKKLMIVSAIAISGLMYQNANAQFGVHFNINLGPRPVYVQPAPVYDDAACYYLPDVEAYYSVREGCYYYQDGGNWVTAEYLPGRYHDYDWRNERHFVVNEGRPYLHNDMYRARYGGFEGHRDWNYRAGYDNRAYAQRGHFDNNPYRGDEHAREYQQHDDHYRYDNRPQVQQNNGYNRNQYVQPQQRNDDHGSDRGYNNNRGGHDGEEGRRGRF